VKDIRDESTGAPFLSNAGVLDPGTVTRGIASSRIRNPIVMISPHANGRVPECPASPPESLSKHQN
jgi:hypothetical protein